MRNFLVVVATACVLFAAGSYLYCQGISDGVARYKRSRQFELTLKSMYVFGVMDGCGHPELCGK